MNVLCILLIIGSIAWDIFSPKIAPYPTDIYGEPIVEEFKEVNYCDTDEYKDWLLQHDTETIKIIMDYKTKDDDDMNIEVE